MVLANVGLVGLEVMGRNLALNMADHGLRVAVYNRTVEKMQRLLADHPDTPGGLVGCATLSELVATLKRPRVIIVLVKAGTAVDAVVEQLIASGIAPEDLVVDAGNSLFSDTIRRERQYASQLKFFGSGVSGGEVGARFGPSLMPGGDRSAYRRLEPIWSAIAAKVDPATGRELLGANPGHPVQGGVPCTAYIGPNGAGHFVKMVHNGIEYADMQVIGESYWLMRELLGLRADAIGDVFASWNRGDLSSYLIEITADILRQRDPVEPKRFLVDQILDTAGQKGTGKWTSTVALELGVPANAIAEAVFARFLSALKGERVAASRVLKGPRRRRLVARRDELVRAIRDALYCSKICAYAQGFQLMSAAEAIHGWDLDFATIARIWRGGCIIRAVFLQRITEAYEKDRHLQNLLMDPYFADRLRKAQTSWRKVVALAAENGISAPTFMSALAYYDGYRAGTLPANLLQGQRDYFGAHTFERVDAPRGQFFHVDWPHPDRPQQAV
ncbi:MAG: NADP-dependent phosphogluconate dehydrogenase [Polyangiaceae bacterium]|nr:NADP-dependent phosphogluconate dehydrogenase [Polyangiaceae bacterium]